MKTLQKTTTKFFNIADKNDTAFISCITSIFLVLGFIGIIHHEMWRDELQAWMIARDSSSLSDLFKNLKYEGHPGLWHICLHVLSIVIDSPVAMQVFHLLIATGVIYVFTRFSPFTKQQKALFAFSYFPFFEYSIISRNYGVGVLLIFLFCAFFPQRNRSYILLSTILALLANTNIYCFIISSCLAMTLLIERIFDKSILGLLSAKKWNISISAAIFLLGITIAIITILPPEDVGLFKGESGFYKGEILSQVNQEASHLSSVMPIVSTIGIIWRSYIPVPKFYNYNFWSSNILMDGSPYIEILGCILALGLLIFSSSLFIQKPVVLFLYLSGTFSILLFSYVRFFGSLRHHGHLFILLVACLWISNYYKESSFMKTRVIDCLNKQKINYFKAILYIHLFAAIFAFVMDLNYPFSASQEVTEFIKSQRLDNMLIVGSRDSAVSPIAALLGKKIYYLESNNFGSFVNWYQRKDLESQEVVDKVNSLIEQDNRNTLLILSQDTEAKRPDLAISRLQDLDAEKPELKISELFKSSKSIDKSETYYLYLIQKQPIKS
jgi:hypothetical protein